MLLLLSQCTFYNLSFYLFKEEDLTESDVKRIKPREGERDKSVSDVKDDDITECKDSSVFEGKIFKDQRKLIGINTGIDKKKRIEVEKKEIARDDEEDADKLKKERRDKFKESPREQKSKKYSDTRKERLKQAEMGKSDKQSVISKLMFSEGKSKSLNYDDIKPFTQLPKVKTDDLTKMIEDMDRKLKVDDQSDSKNQEKNDLETSKFRRNSLDSGDMSGKEESSLKTQKSLDERSRSSDREGSEEKEKGDGSDRRTEKRIRNKVICFLVLGLLLLKNLAILIF